MTYEHANIYLLMVYKKIHNCTVRDKNSIRSNNMKKTTNSLHDKKENSVQNETDVYFYVEWIKLINVLFNEIISFKQFKTAQYLIII